ncbi:hypothetical protein [Bacteroides ovatus]|nr:hypothetical protein [Bacteroides ovatus]
MAFHGSCHKKKICTEEGITNKKQWYPLLIFKQLKKTDMKDLRLKFKGIDDWNRPVFMDDNGRYFGDTDHLFDYTASKDDVLNFYRNMSLNNCICYFGQQFGCEPMGIEIKSNVKIILE